MHKTSLVLNTESYDEKTLHSAQYQLLHASLSGQWKILCLSIYVPVTPSRRANILL